MKLHPSLAAMLLLFFLCSFTEKETIITGKVVGNADKLIYSNPHQGTCYPGFRDTINIDEKGNFELKFNLKQPTFVVLWTNEGKGHYKLLIERGESYNILFEADDKVKISGANEEGQRLYSTLPDPAFISQQTRDYENESSLDVIHKNIQDIKSAEISKFEELLARKSISNSFFELVQKDRECYYASLESRVLQIKIYNFIQNNSEINTDNTLSNLGNTYAKYSPNNKDLISSSFWPEYARFFIQDYIPFSKDDFNVDDLKKLYEEEKINTFMINESKKHLRGKALEFFQATYIHHVSIQNKFEKELISLFEQFEKDYPASEYSKYIRPFIAPIIDFYNKIDRDYEEDISFIENSENINTLDEAISSLRGKKIYIDIWATWCGPCKREFEHSEKLNSILKEKDIQILYISIDKEQDETQWKNLIKYYNLKGKHIRANESFCKELYRMYDEKNLSIAIPWYILIDEKGNILQKEAKHPSEIVLGEDI